MRLRVEFTTEPFDLEQAPQHAVVAREVVQSAGLHAVDVGPFGNTAEGGSEDVLATVDALLRRALGAGATRVSLQLNVIAETGAETADEAGSGSEAGSETGSGAEAGAETGSEAETGAGAEDVRLSGGTGEGEA